MICGIEISKRLGYCLDNETENVLRESDELAAMINGFIKRLKAENMKQLYYNVDKCLGCKSCEIACAVGHSISGDLFKLLEEKPLSLPRKKVYAASGKNYPVSCRHCQEPKCVDACMAAALVYDKEKAMVLCDEGRCVGCWMCVMVCPYGAVRPNLKTRLPVRCDKCKDKDEPSCVRACPTGAIKNR